MKEREGQLIRREGTDNEIEKIKGQMRKKEENDR